MHMLPVAVVQSSFAGSVRLYVLLVLWMI